MVEQLGTYKAGQVSAYKTTNPEFGLREYLLQGHSLRKFWSRKIGLTISRTILLILQIVWPYSGPLYLKA